MADLWQTWHVFSFFRSAVRLSRAGRIGGITYFPLSVQILQAWTSYQESSFSHVVKFSVNFPFWLSLRALLGVFTQGRFGFLFCFLSFEPEYSMRTQNHRNRTLPTDWCRISLFVTADDNRMELLYKVCFVKPKDAFLQSISCLFYVLQKEMTLPLITRALHWLLSFSVVSTKELWTSLKACWLHKVFKRRLF